MIALSSLRQVDPSWCSFRHKVLTSVKLFPPYSIFYSFTITYTWCARHAFVKNQSEADDVYKDTVMSHDRISWIQDSHLIPFHQHRVEPLNPYILFWETLRLLRAAVNPYKTNVEQFSLLLSSFVLQVWALDLKPLSFLINMCRGMKWSLGHLWCSKNCIQLFWDDASNLWGR